MNHSVEWLEHSESGEDVWKHYGTIARIMELEGETQVLIIRTSDAKHEYQPLQDVIEGDTIRLGKEIGNSSRGRKTSRGKYVSRGHAPSRVRKSRSDSLLLKRNTFTGGNQSPKPSFAGEQHGSVVGGCIKTVGVINTPAAPIFFYPMGSSGQ